MFVEIVIKLALSVRVVWSRIVLEGCLKMDNLKLFKATCAIIIDKRFYLGITH